MFDELDHTRITGYHLQNQNDFTTNWTRPNSNVTQVINNVAQVYMKTTEEKRRSSDNLNYLNNPFQSLIENPKKIYSLQNLNQLERCNVNHPKISHGVISAHSTPLHSLICRGSHNANSSMNMDYGCYNSASVNGSNVFGGSSFEGYHQNEHRTNVSCDGMNFISLMDVNQTGLELVTSPGQKSSIAACSYEDGISDTKAFDIKADLPGSFLHSISGPSVKLFYQHQGQHQSSIGEKQIAYNTDIPDQWNYSNSSNLQQNFQYHPATDYSLPCNYNTHQSTCGISSQFQLQMTAPHQLHHWTQYLLQLDDQLKDQSNALSGTANVFMKSRNREYNLVEPASNESWIGTSAREQKYDLVEPSSNESWTGTATLADILPPNYLNCLDGDQFSQDLCAALNQQDLSFQQPDWDQWPANVCMESRYNLVEPASNESWIGTSTRKRKHDLVEPSSNESWTGTGTLADMLPPNYLNGSVGYQFSQDSSASLSQQDLSFQLPGLKQSPETRVHEHVSEVKMDILTSASGPNVNTTVTEDNTGNIQRKIVDVSWHEQKSELSKGNRNTTNEEFKEPPELSFEETNSIEKEESNQVGPKVICEFNTTSDVHELEMDSMQSVTPNVSSVDCKGFGLESRNIETLNALLDDSFTASQIKDHLSSFIQHKEISGNTTPLDGQYRCQLCSMDKLLLAPAPIYCASCGSRIKRNVGYYHSADEDSTRHCFCMPCFKGSHKSILKFGGVSVSKTKLQKAWNVEEEDSWVQCDKCDHWQHRICGLYNDERDAEEKEEYVCPRCFIQEIEDGKRVPLPQTSLFEAKDLPRTNLSDHIEQRLFLRMKQEREETAKVLGVELGKVPEAEGLVVRVVLSADKQLEVKQQFRDIIHGEYYPAEFSYKSKIIFLFQRLGGVDVCLFGMCVQEFGSECDGPNHRCVYISYIDSVKYFKPERNTGSGESLRTFVYQEILIGYLEHCKKRGFAKCYIWACPLIKGEDYIFYCHPETQKTPKQDRLRQWYKSVLRKATEDDIVVDCTNLYNQFFVPARQGNSKITAASLPYFDGDYWSGAAEVIIKKLKEEESSGRPRSKLPTKRILTAMGDYNVDVVTNDVLVMQKLGENILPLKENFMVAHLHYECTYCHKAILSGSRWFCKKCNKIQLCSRCYNARKLRTRSRKHTCHSGESGRLSKGVLDYVPLDTNSEDDLLVNSFFESRDDFLNKCEKSLYQFDTIGNAKHSSMKILYHLMQKLVVQKICTLCNNHVLIDQCWCCDTCVKLYVCDPCYETKGDAWHIHKLTHLSAKVISETKSKQPQEQNVVSLQTALDALVHASQCNRTQCSYLNCEAIRKLLQHVSECRVTALCKTCNRAWLILKEHTQICTDVLCGIPHCMDIRKHRATVGSISESKENPTKFRSGVIISSAVK